VNLQSSNFFVYRASAGSGKTYTIALQYIRQLLRGVSHRQILAVTFTKDATGEMKERILAELYGLAFLHDNDAKSKTFMQDLQRELPQLSEEEISQRAKSALHAILHDYSRFHITTIDSFFQQVVRNLAKELGVGSQFNIELDTDIPVHDAVKAVLQEASENPATLNRISEFIEHKLEDGRWKIETDLYDFGKNIFQESFQEQEKLLRAQLKDNPEKIKETIAECKRFRKIFENTMTQFADSFSESGFDFFQGTRGVPSYFRKIQKKDYAEPNSYVNSVLSGDKGKDGDLHYLNLLQETENYRSRNIPKYNSACLLLKYIYQLELIRNISEKIDEQNIEQNRFMLAKTAQLLNEMVGDSDASFVYEKIGAEIRHVVIDEFQDTSTMQWKNFRSLISEMLANRRFGMLVGDVKQSIYRWRNGNWRILNDIETEFPQANPKTLDTNWRSAKKIVDFNNDFFRRAAENMSSPVGKAYENVAQKSNDKTDSGYVSVDFVEKDDERTLNEVVIDTLAEKIKTLTDSGVSVSDICIICRHNEQIREIAARLPQLVDVAIISPEAYQFDSSRTIRVIIAVLRSIVEPENMAPRAEIFRYLYPDESFQNLKDAALNIPQQNLPLYDLIQEICRNFRFAESGESSFLYAFMDRTADYLSRNSADIRGFLEYWDTKLYRESVPLPTGDANRNGILAMTIHKSKGLEFHTVIVPFVGWEMTPKHTPRKQNILWCGSDDAPFDLALFPVEYSERLRNSLFAPSFDSETEMLEMDNLNLLYVAFTRAQNNLVAIAQQPAKSGDSATIQKILFNILNGNYETGKIVATGKKQSSASENIFRNPDSQMEEIRYNPVHTEVQYRQTSEAQRFVKGDEGWENRNEYVREGNVVHSLFEYIKTAADVEKALGRLIEKGVIHLSNKEKYAAKIRSYIAQKPEWFTEKYRVINECSILTPTAKYRCDRVMIDAQGNATVVDYKTGNEDSRHQKQVGEYLQLLEKMGYPKSEGYVWYLNNNKILKIK